MIHIFTRTPVFARALFGAILTLVLAPAFIFSGEALADEVSVITPDGTKSGEAPDNLAASTPATVVDDLTLRPGQSVEELLKKFDGRRAELDEKNHLKYLARLKQDKLRYEIEAQRLKNTQ